MIPTNFSHLIRDCDFIASVSVIGFGKINYTEALCAWLTTCDILSPCKFSANTLV